MAAGFGLLSKYTAFFLGLGMLFWLLAVPSERRWLGTFWPYLGAAIALLMFAPVILWNARARLGFVRPAIRLRRMAGSRCAIWASLAGILASPFIAILGVAGLVSIARAPGSHRALIAALMAPAIAFSSGSRCAAGCRAIGRPFFYPAFAVAAVAASLSPALQQWTALRWSAAWRRRWRLS